MKYRKILVLSVFLLFFSAIAYAGTAFFTYEKTSGMTKICYYDYLGSEIAITLPSTRLCPLTIKYP